MQRPSTLIPSSNFRVPAVVAVKFKMLDLSSFLKTKIMKKVQYHEKINLINFMCVLGNDFVVDEDDG